MNRLDIDFCATRRASPWVGRLLLGLALAVCLDAGLAWRGLTSSLEEGETRLGRRAPASAARVTPQEIAAARDTVQRLSLPWDELFRALEGAANEQVALVSIEPDVRAGTVTISADGKDYLAALTYVANLSRTEGMEAVQLVRHEQKGNDPQGAVSFAVSATWQAK